MSGKLQFWKPGTLGPGSNLDRASELEGNVIQSAPIASQLGRQAQRASLPIFKHSEPVRSSQSNPTDNIDLNRGKNTLLYRKARCCHCGRRDRLRKDDAQDTYLRG